LCVVSASFVIAQNGKSLVYGGVVLCLVLVFLLCGCFCVYWCLFVVFVFCSVVCCGVGHFLLNVCFYVLGKS